MMKRVRTVFLALLCAGFAFLGSCALVSVDPELTGTVYYAESESYYGTFGLGVEITNTGGRDAVGLEYNLYIFGSEMGIISYGLSYEYSDPVYSVTAGTKANSLFIGAADTYVPCYYELFVYWYDDTGKRYGPINVEGAFAVDRSPEPRRIEEVP
jgi:hypothetical protein